MPYQPQPQPETIPQLKTRLRSERNYSAYRAKQAAEYIVSGFGDFRVFYGLNPFRGIPWKSPGNVLPAERKDYTIICRPATSGNWGKSVQLRAYRTEDITEVI